MTKQTRGAMDKAQTDLLPGITPMIFFFFISWDFKHQNSGKEKEKS
jgi:hypothetical protein